ncbi:MAG: metallophosphoesterase [Oscillospiraceae bacterium]|nr:metallophosphoesterase [Oscillospiraceae bacterium]
MFNRRKRKKARRRAFAIIAAALLLVFYAFVYSNSVVVADEYRVSIKDLPAAFEGYRIAIVSDVHGNTFGEDNENLLAPLREQQPDMIAITGDICDRKFPSDAIPGLLAQLVEIAPVYYVTGNHEWAAKYVGTMMEYCEEFGITPLRNEYVLLQEGEDHLILAGIDDKNAYADQKTPDQLMEEIVAEQGDEPTILLSHRPDLIRDFWVMGYDLVLAGHIHGGIVQIPKVGGLVAPSRRLWPEFSKGLYTAPNGSSLVISAGLAGIHIKQPRLFNPLHVPIVILEGVE